MPGRHRGVRLISLLVARAPSPEVTHKRKVLTAQQAAKLLALRNSGPANPAASAARPRAAGATAATGNLTEFEGPKSGSERTFSIHGNDAIDPQETYEAGNFC